MNWLQLSRVNLAVLGKKFCIMLVPSPEEYISNNVCTSSMLG